MTIKADNYNQQQLDQEHLTMAEVTRLVEYYQKRAGLPVDGMAGPYTLSRLGVSKSPGRLLMRSALRIAIDCLGEGEVEANNKSAWLDKVRQKDGTGLPWRGYKAPWCAAFVSYCYMQAIKGTGSKLPWVSSRSSRALERLLRANGVVHETPQPGAVAIFRRGVLGRAGHVGLVERYDSKTGRVHTIEGNASKFPSKVERRVYSKWLWARKAIGSFGF